MNNHMGISNSSTCEQTIQKKKKKDGATSKRPNIPFIFFSLLVFSFLFQGFLGNQIEGKGKKENKPGGRIACTSSWRNSCPCRRLPAPPHSSSSFLRPLALQELGLGVSSTLCLLRIARMILWAIVGYSFSRGFGVLLFSIVFYFLLFVNSCLGILFFKV